MNYANFALYGFVILFIINLYYFKLNLKQNNYIIFGSFLITIGLFYATLEKYNSIKGKKADQISKSHLILGGSQLLSFILPINNHSKKTDIFGIIGHFILINTNFGYTEIANICLTIYYSLYVYRNGVKENIINKIQGLAGGLVLLYYIKKTIDNWYTKREQKEQKLEDKHK